MGSEVGGPIPSSNEQTTGATDDWIASQCAALVQQTLPPFDSATVIVHFASARSAARPDQLRVVEVPYSTSAPAGGITGSYVCGVSPTGEIAFYSDHERVTEKQWRDFTSGTRPGNLDARR